MAMVDEVTETHQDAIERPPSDLSTVELNGQVPRHYKEFLQAYRALLDSRGNISLKGEVSERRASRFRAEAGRYRMSTRALVAWILELAAEGFSD